MKDVQNVNWILELSRILGVVVACCTLIKVASANTNRRISLLEKSVPKKRDAEDCKIMTDQCPTKIQIDNYADLLSSIREELKVLRQELKLEIRDLRITFERHISNFHIPNNGKG